MVAPTTRLQEPHWFIINNGTKDLKYPIALNRNKVRQWRKTKVRIQAGEGELVKHWDSWHAGMGWSRDESRDAQYAPPVYEYGPCCAATRGVLYPPLDLGTVDLATDVGNLPYPASIDRVVEIDDYIYFFGTDGPDIHVMKVDPSDNSLVYRRTFSNWAAPAGQPVEFGGYWYVPCAGGRFKELSAVADDLTGAFLISGAETNKTYTIEADGDDGFLLKSHPTSYAGARAATATVDSQYVYVGQQKYATSSFSIMRAYLRFNTSAIGATTVLSAKLRVFLWADHSDTDFTIQVRKKSWGATLEAADWSATPSGDTLMGSVVVGGASWPETNGNWVEITLDPTTIETTAYAEMYLISTRDDDDPGTAPTGEEYVQFANKGNSMFPAELLLTYSTGGIILDNTAKANGLGGTGFMLLGDNIDDIFYWGLATKFEGIYVNIDSPANTALTLDFEFWNGAAWTDVIGPETDGTSGFTVDGWVTWDAGAQTGWATAMVNGVTAYWVRVKTTTAATTWPTATWTPPCDWWTDGPSDRRAWHMGAAGKLLWRVGDGSTPAKHHVVNSCAAMSSGGSGGPLTVGNWSDPADYVIGKPGRSINSIAELGRWAYFGKEEGLIGSDSEGNQNNALDFTRMFVVSTNCNCTVRWLGTLVTTHKTGLWQYTGVSARPIGIETLEGNASVVKGGRYVALAASGEWLYAVYRVGTIDYILAARPGQEGEPPVVWHQLQTCPSGAYFSHINDIAISGLTTNPKLWIAIRLLSDPNLLLYYMTLAPDGSPDPTATGMAFENLLPSYYVLLPAVDWGAPGTLKRGHMIEVTLGQAAGTNGTFRVYNSWDGGAFIQVGAEIISTGTTRRFWTPGTADSGYVPQVRLGFTSAPNQFYVKKVSLYCVALPRKEPIITTVVRCGDNLDRLRDAKTMYDDLEALENAGVYTVRDPDDPASGTFKAIVENVDEHKSEQIGEVSGERLVAVTLRVVEYV